MSLLIEQLEARLAEIERQMGSMPEPARIGMKMLAEEITERRNLSRSWWRK